MSALRHHRIQDLFMLVLGVIVLIIGFGDMLPELNQHLLGGGLDGWKNYYTPSWYVKYDSGFSFTGMNYPYGEHILYTDNQPIISGILGFIHRNIYPISDYTVGILNFLVFLSLLGCMWLIFRIERLLGVAWWMAIPGAILIALMSPQIHRFAGHYALAYAVVIPAIWYAMIRVRQAPFQWWRYLLLGVGLLFLAWIHAYYLLMGLLMTLAFSLVDVLQHFQQRNRALWWRVGGMVGAGLFAIAGFQIILILTDHIADRPANPFGFLDYKASWTSVFLPVQGPLYEGWHMFARYVKPAPIEGFAYVGAVASVIGIAWLARLGKLALRRRWGRIGRPLLPGELRLAFWASFLILLFSMAIPFQWFPQWLLDLLGPLRQFRSLGRFAWIFYYPFTVLTVYTLYQVYRAMASRGLRTLAVWFLLAAAGFWTWEMSIHVKLHADAMRSHKGDNIFINEEPDFAACLKEAGVEVEDFQALLPIPAFNIGSEKYVSRWQTEPTTARAFKMSYDLGLPLACGMMSRTSIHESNNLVQLLSSPWIQKDIIQDYPDDRPLLVLAQSETPITWEEQLLLRRTKVLLEKGNFSIRELQLRDLAYDPDLLVAQFQAGKSTLDSLGKGWYVSEDSALFFYEGFDGDSPSEFGVETATCQAGEVELNLFHGPLPKEKMVVTVWVKIDHTVAGFPAFLLREFNAQDEMIRDEAHGIMFGTNVYRDFLQFEFEFTPSEEASRVHICLYDRDPEAESFLIRPVGVDVFRENLPGHRLMKNNFYVE